MSANELQVGIQRHEKLLRETGNKRLVQRLRKGASAEIHPDRKRTEGGDAAASHRLVGTNQHPVLP